MAVIQRLRRTAYDNIARGSATGVERTVAGETVSWLERHGGGRYTSTSTEVGSGGLGQTNVAAGTSTTDDNFGPDNMTAAVNPTDERIASSNTAGAVTNA